MRNTYVVTRSFSYKNKDAFDLSIIHVDFGNSHLYLIKSVTLPFQLTNKFYTLVDENKIIENGTYNHEYCNDLLETIAEFIFEENKIYSPFFYPCDFLNSSNAIQDDFIKKYDSTKKEIRQSSYGFFYDTSMKVLVFNNVLKLIKVLGTKFYLKKKKISRAEFEIHILDFETGAAYTEVYNDIVLFSLLFSTKTNLPVCAIAFSAKRQIKFCIITGNESVSI